MTQFDWLTHEIDFVTNKVKKSDTFSRYRTTCYERRPCLRSRGKHGLDS